MNPCILHRVSNDINPEICCPDPLPNHVCGNRALRQSPAVYCREEGGERPSPFQIPPVLKYPAWAAAGVLMVAVYAVMMAMFFMVLIATGAEVTTIVVISIKVEETTAQGNIP